MLRNKYNFQFMWHDEDDADRNGRLKKPQKVENNVQYNDSMDNKCNLQQIKSSVGVIKSNWYNKSNQKKILLSQTYGTAFAISPQKLLTCTHNIYSQYKQKFASQIQFCPAIAKGYVKKQQYIVEKQLEYNKNIFSLFHYYENCNKNFDAKPQEDQICIIYLSGQLKIKQYIQIGQLDRKTIDLQIFGYPSEDYKTQSFINANINRLHLKGCLERIEDDVIHHTLETKTGCSGAPILAKANKTYYAVGIHTHRGMGNAHYNSGVYFSQKILKRIEDLEFCISVRWNLKPDIQYINNKSGCQSLSPSNPAQQFQDFNEFEKQNIFQIKQAINLQQNDQIPKQQQQKQKILMLQIKNQQNNSSNSSNNFSIIQKNMPISQQKMKCQQIQQQSIQLDQIISKIKQNFMIQEQIDRYNLCQRRQYKIQEYQDDSYSHSIINDSFLRDQQGLFSSDQSVSNRSIIDFKDIIDYFSQFKTESQEYQTSQCSSNNKIPQYIFNCYQMYIIPRIFIKKIILLSFRMLTIIIS